MHDMRRYIFRGNMMDLIGATFRAESELAGVCSKPNSNIFGEVWSMLAAFWKMFESMLFSSRLGKVCE